jgi:DNA (cytosine-5)-methyltransferase 1
MVLKVGTDCSGIEAPIQALKKLNIEHDHVFSSEIDKSCIKTLKENYEIPIIFTDITKRKIEDVPDIDLYICGFPCQPFSQAGDRKGFSDSRGNVFWNCLDVIKTKQPKYFILENVKNILKHDKGKTWSIIKQSLEDLPEYSVYWKVLNTRDYGIPQNRERLWIVGVRNGTFDWPEKYENIEPILNYVDHTDITKTEWKRKTSLEHVRPDGGFIDVDFLHYTSYPNCHIYSPCVVARGSSLWCVPYHRYANVKEFARLQGFPDDFKQVVSNSQMKKQFGNSMSVNVLCNIFKNLI